MIHTISVVNLDGVVAMCQHYDRGTPEEQAEWEEVLANVIFVEDGGLVRESCQRSDVVRVVGSKFVYVRFHDGLILSVTGSEEHDELELKSVMDHVVEIITAACDKKFTDGQIAKFHGKVCVCLSEMIHEGTVLLTDLDRVMQMSKLKPVKLKA